jgi:hypothetical protein
MNTEVQQRIYVATQALEAGDSPSAGDALDAALEHAEALEGPFGETVALILFEQHKLYTEQGDYLRAASVQKRFLMIAAQYCRRRYLMDSSELYC